MRRARTRAHTPARTRARGCECVHRRRRRRADACPPAPAPPGRLTPDAIEYLAPREIAITLPQIPDYDIRAPETLVLTVPAAVMRNNDAPIVAAARFVVLAARGAAELGGSALNAIEERCAVAPPLAPRRRPPLPCCSISPAPVTQPHRRRSDLRTTNVSLDVRLHADSLAEGVAWCDARGMQTVLALDVQPLDSEWCWPVPGLPASVVYAPPPPPPGTPRCAPQQSYGWARELAALPCAGLTKLGPRHLRLTLPPFAGYTLETAETISVAIRAFALTSNRTTAALPAAFSVHPTAPTAVASGSLAQGANESAVRAGGLTLLVKLAGGAWRPALDRPTRRAVLRGLGSAQREPHGWDLAVRPYLTGDELTQVTRAHARARRRHRPVGAPTAPSDRAVRPPPPLPSRPLPSPSAPRRPRRMPCPLAQLDEHTVRVVLPPYPGYDLRTAETLTMRVPVAALLAARAIEVQPPLVIAAVPGVASYAGFVEYDASERAVRSGVSSRWSVDANALLSEPMALTITLADDEWADALGAPSSVESWEFLASLTADGAPPPPPPPTAAGAGGAGLGASPEGGWDEVVLPALRPRHLFRRDARTLRIELPARANFGISAPQALRLRIPPLALASNSTPLEAPPIVVVAIGGLARPSGSLLVHLHEEDLRSLPLQLNLTLSRDAWVPLLEAKFAHQLLAGIRAHSDPGDGAAAEPAGWGAVVLPTLRPRHVTRVDATTVTIDLAEAPAYDIATPETLRSTPRSPPRRAPLPPLIANPVPSPAPPRARAPTHLCPRPHPPVPAPPPTRARAPRAVTIPASAVVSNQSLALPDELVVLPQPGRVRIAGGTLLAHADELAIRSAAEHTLLLELQNDTWRGDAVAYDAGDGPLSQLRWGLRTAADAEPAGWNAIVRVDTLANPQLWAISNGSRLMTVTLPQAAEYDIASPELLTITVPPDALASRQRVRADGGVRLDARRGVAQLDHHSSLLANATEADLRSAEPLSVVVRLRGDSFVHSVGDDSEATAALLAGFRSAQAEPAGWNVVALRALDFNAVTRLSPTALRIDVPQCAQYAVRAPETLTLRVPDIAVASNLPIAATPSVVLRARPGVATLGGTLLGAPTEATLRAGGATLTISLADDAFARAAFDGDHARLTAVVAELAASAQTVDGEATPTGWDAVIRPLLAGLNATLAADARTLTFTLPPSPAYRIGRPETVVVRVPALALASATPIAAVPPLVLRAGARTVALGGHLVDAPHEATIQAEGGTNLTLILDDDVWQPTVGLPHLGAEARALALALLDGVVSAQAEPAGWRRVVRPSLSPTAVARVDDRTVRISLPPAAAYAISQPETLTVHVPPEAVLSAAPPVLRAALVLRPTAGRARLSGTFLRDASEAAVRSAAPLEIAITLQGDAWAPAVGRQEATDAAITDALLDGLRSHADTADEPRGWAAIVRAGLGASHVARVGRRTVVVSVPQFLAYDILAPETLEVQIPGQVSAARPRATRCTRRPPAVRRPACPRALDRPPPPPRPDPRAAPRRQALRSGESIVAVPRLRILAANGTLEAGGSLLGSPTEAAIADVDAPPPTLVLRLLQDAWVDGLGLARDVNGSLVAEAPAAAEALIDGLRSQQQGALGWNNVVRAALRPTDLRRLDNATLELALPDARASYAIETPETLVFTAPELALRSGRQVVVEPPVVITPQPGVARLSNSLVSNNSETDVQGGGMQVTVTLQGDAWAAGIGQHGDGSAASLTKQVLGAFISAQDERCARASPSLAHARAPRLRARLSPLPSPVRPSPPSGGPLPRTSALTAGKTPPPALTLPIPRPPPQRRVECAGAVGPPVHRPELRGRRVGDAHAAELPRVQPAQGGDDLGQSAAGCRRLAAGDLRWHRRRRRRRRRGGAADLGQHGDDPALGLALRRRQRDDAEVGPLVPDHHHAHGRHVDPGGRPAGRDGRGRLRAAAARADEPAVGALRLGGRRRAVEPRAARRPPPPPPPGC